MAAAAPARTRRAPAPARRRPPQKPVRGRKPQRGAIRVVRRNPVAHPAAAFGAGVLDRLLRGRAWIACIGVLLVGVVFFNVNLLQVNRGITATSERAAELRRENAELRLDVARLASSERIQTAAGELGFVLPKPGDVRYLRSRPRADARRAARGIEAPDTAAVQPQAVPAPTAPPVQAPAPATAQPPPAAAAPPAATPQPQPQTPPPAAGAPTAATGGTG